MNELCVYIYIHTIFGYFLEESEKRAEYVHVDVRSSCERKIDWEV